MYLLQIGSVKYFFEFFIIVLIGVGFCTQFVFGEPPEFKNDFATLTKCQYTGKVSPQEFQEKVKKIYTDMCIWWGKTFPSKPLRDDITLNNVDFAKVPKDKESSKGLRERAYGLFWWLDKKDVNNIFVKYPIPDNDDTWKKIPVVVDGILAHEIFHFFKKSCCFDSFIKLREDGDKINGAVLEASAYWAQDLFLKRNYDRGLLDLMIKAEDEKDWHVSKIVDLDEDWKSLLMISYPKQLFHSVRWFDQAPQETLDELLNGYYLIYDDGDD